MYWKANRTSIAFIVSLSMVTTPTVAIAKAVVVKSSGNAARTYPRDKQLPDDAILLLGRGDSVTIEVKNSRRVFSGPGKFPIKRAAQRRSAVSIFQSIMNFISGDSAVTVGAARGRAFTTAAPASKRKPTIKGFKTKKAARPGSASARRPLMKRPAPPPPPPPPATGSSAGSAGALYSLFKDTPPSLVRMVDQIDIAKSENICVYDGARLRFWRASSDGPKALILVRQSDQYAAAVSFTRGKQLSAKSDEISSESIGNYKLVDVESGEASQISIVSIGQKPETLVGTAKALSEKNCVGQLAALENEIIKKRR